MSPNRGTPYNVLSMSGFGVFVSLTAFALASAFPILASVQATQNPPRSTVASGGTVAAQSATHRVSGTIGQIASNRPQSAVNTVAGGFWNTTGFCDCPYIGDLDTNSTMDILDVIAVINVAFRGGAYPPGDRFCPLWTRADLNCDSVVDVFDVASVISTAFRNIDDRCNPCNY